ncbi:MAG: hypothetical protein JXA71_00985 [Chitinispirillaceae bacterium]|nr:hypothetical protein [Chitinispirillaceae bacterium]
MRTDTVITAVLLCMLAACSQKPKEEAKEFSLEPVVVGFEKGPVHHLFPVVRSNSIGLVYGRQWAIGTFDGHRIQLEIFPQKEFSSPLSKALPQAIPDKLFIKGGKGFFYLDWKKKKTTADFIDKSKGLGVGIDKAKVINEKNGLILSIFRYDNESMLFHHQFVIDDIFNKQRLKELPIPPHLSPLAAYFTPSYVFYHYRTVDFSSPWMALDNNLDTVSHPLVDLLNGAVADSILLVRHDNMLVSEERKYALIFSKNPKAKRETIYLAEWHDTPCIREVAFDTAIIAGDKNLVTGCDLNTMSPSGKWCFFTVDGYRAWIQDSYFLIYCDPEQPEGCSRPMPLAIQDDIEYASWMTDPEGLVLFGKGRFLYYDLSRFDPHSYGRQASAPP